MHIHRKRKAKHHGIFTIELDEVQLSYMFERLGLLSPMEERDHKKLETILNTVLDDWLAE